MPRRSLTVARRRACALALGALLAAPACTLGAPDGAQISTQGANGAPACVTCHGAKGEGNPSAGFPRLAGLGAKYLTEQLDAMADGGRVSPIMKATAQALDPAQRQAVAAYYASLPAPLDTDKLAATAMGRAASADTGAWLATRGAWDKNVPPATNAMVPAASASATTSPRWRPVGCLHFRAVARLAPGQRPPGPLGLMPAVATRLTDAEIDAVSAYYAGLPQAAEQLAARRRTGSQAMNPRLTRLLRRLARRRPRPVDVRHRAGRRAAPTPPSAASLPDTEFGKIVRQGEQIFLHTPQAAGKFVGNDLNCSSCHLDAGRRGLGAHVGRLCAVSRIPSQERSRQYAGRAPAGLFPLQHERQAARRRRSRADRVADLYVLAGQQGADRRDAGRPGLPQATRAGAEGRLPAWRKVYAQYCAVCHGAEGQGQKNGKHWVFPALWGRTRSTGARACTRSATRPVSSRPTCRWDRPAC